MKEESENSDLYRNFEIYVCTAEHSFKGTIRSEYGQRLIDALNEGVPMGTSSRGQDFLALANVKLRGAGGSEASYAHLYIAKRNIIFIAHRIEDGKDKPLSSYPYRQKIPVQVEVYSAPYTIKGHIHSDSWENLEDTIEAKIIFLPVTSARISPALPEGHTQFEFVAVNKEKIIYLFENPPKD